MRRTVTGTAEALAAGWRAAPASALRVWPLLAAAAAGEAGVLCADRLGLSAPAAETLASAGAGLFVVTLGPKLARLHGAAGGPGPRWGRLLATAVALVGLAGVLAGACLVAAVGLAWAAGPEAARGDAGPVPRLLALAPLAPLAVGALLVLGRFAVTLAADAAESEARFARGWILTRGAPVAPGLVLLLATLAPTAALVAALAAGDAAAAAQNRGGAWAAWALAAALGACSQFLWAPMSAGALRHLYTEGLRRERAGCDAPPLRDPPSSHAPPAEPLAS